MPLRKASNPEEVYLPENLELAKEVASDRRKRFLEETYPHLAVEGSLSLFGVYLVILEVHGKLLAAFEGKFIGLFLTILSLGLILREKAKFQERLAALETALGRLQAHALAEGGSLLPSRNGSSSRRGGK